MTDDLARIFLLVATLSSVVVVFGSFTRREKGWSDWSLIAGASLLTVGFGSLTLVFFNLGHWLGRYAQFPFLGSIGLGAVLFTMGFVMDQLRHRSIRRYREQLTAMEQSGGSLPTERPGAHE